MKADRSPRRKRKLLRMSMTNDGVGVVDIHASVVVFKKMFKPVDFDEDATRITELSMSVLNVAALGD